MKSNSHRAETHVVVFSKVWDFHDRINKPLNFQRPYNSLKTYLNTYQFIIKNLRELKAPIIQTTTHFI